MELEHEYVGPVKVQHEPFQQEKMDVEVDVKVEEATAEVEEVTAEVEDEFLLQLPVGGQHLHLEIQYHQLEMP